MRGPAWACRSGRSTASIVSIKDLFDVAGEPTRAGSKILAEEAKPAAADAAIVRRLRAGGAVIVAKTNMTEFAFSGVGANPHFGTPGNPRDRARVPGGSSAGAAVAVADGMCEIADRHRHRRLGAHSGGAVRPGRLQAEPAARADRWRVSVELHARLDRPDRAQRRRLRQGRRRYGRRDGRFSFAPLEAGARCRPAFRHRRRACRSMDSTKPSRRRFAAASNGSTAPACGVSRRNLAAVRRHGAVNAKGGISPPEACAIHRDCMGRRATDIDPNVAARIERGCAVSAADYVDMMRARARLVRAMDARLAGLDALIMPTTSIVAPTIAEVADPKVFAVRNAALLRNTAIINFFDLCAVTLPLPVAPPAMPVGLMVVVRNGQDRRLLSVAAALATLFAA